jgi:hypothetical protein
VRRQIITFPAGDFDLAGFLDLPVPASGAERVPGVIFCHGFTGNHIEARRLYSRLVRRLVGFGIGCFRFDHRGCGESEGDFIDFTPTGMLEDLDAALKVFLEPGCFDPARLAVVGYSLGGTSASYLMSRHTGFRTAVLWAPVARPEIIRERMSQMPAFEGYRERGFMDFAGLRVSRHYLDEVGERTSPVPWAADFPGPILFCHGEEDEVVSPEHSELFLKARNNPGDGRLLIPAADHGFGSAAMIDLLLDETERWLVEKLLR